MPLRLPINFISNLALSETSGGWSGINVALFRELSKYFATRFVGPVNPRSDYPAKLVSKIKRVNGRRGAFHFFSERRLRKIAKLVNSQVDKSASCDFYHGSTPWILYQPERPYFLYVDTCFSTYVDVYHDRVIFQKDDLKRIGECEAQWLTRATHVFFGTRWALERAVEDYRIPQANLSVAGAGGSMTPPARDQYRGGMDFLFIALNFERKGGRICAQAFQSVVQQFPHARLKVLGERPPADILALPGVSYEGFLNKSDPADLKLLEQIYESAFALVHPTSSDIQPLVISEAGYFGCPSIAARSFGIPELIQHGITGFLVDTPLTSSAFAERMLHLCSNSEHYQSMRQAAHQHSINSLTWSAVGSRLASSMHASLELI